MKSKVKKAMKYIYILLLIAFIVNVLKTPIKTGFNQLFPPNKSITFLHQINFKKLKSII